MCVGRWFGSLFLVTRQRLNYNGHFISTISHVGAVDSDGDGSDVWASFDWLRSNVHSRVVLYAVPFSRCRIGQ